MAVIADTIMDATIVDISITSFWISDYCISAIMLNMIATMENTMVAICVASRSAL